MTDQDAQTASAQDSAPLHGILAEYDTPTAVVKASKKVRDAGYTRWDTYTPFPIHGIDSAMGIKMTKLPWFVICAALTGLTTAIVLQWWTNAVDYKWLISGKPFWSWPANVPIMFELTVLFSAFATLGGMFALNNLPLPSHPLDLKERFRRVSDDKFFLLIEARDPRFDEEATRKLLEETTPVVLDDVPEDRTTSDKLPKPLVYVLILAVCASLVPFALFAQARSAKMDHGRRHLVWDMDFAPSYKAQTANPLFEDGRSMRVPPEGTVAQGQLNADDHLHLGKTPSGDWALTLPEGVKADAETMDDGEVQFGIYCTPCHGHNGDGNGMVNQRLTGKAGHAWVPPTNLHDARLRTMPAGELYNTIKNGIRNMPGYGSQMDAEERWAVVLYVRALQKSSSAPSGQLSDKDRGQLK
jgi:mono/diheme cytochrome c family protein